MQAWSIKAEVAEGEDWDTFVDALEHVLQMAIEFKPTDEPTPVEWLNGLWAGMAEVNNIIVCPDEYPNARATAKEALIRLASLMLKFQQVL